MSPRLLVLFGLVAVAVATACSSPGSRSQETVEPRDPVEPAGDSVPAVAEPALPKAALPEAMSAVGESCGDNVNAPIELDGGRVHYCGSDHLIAGVLVPVDFVHDIPPANAEVIQQRINDGGVIRGNSLTVAVEGERLWIHHVTCGMCRRIMGIAFVGDLDRLDDYALSDIQRRLQLPGAPLLRTSADWRDALADTR